MPRDWLDLVVDEADGLPRYNLVDRNGNIAAADIRVEVASKVVQDGDRAGALAFNRVTELDDDGTPLLAVDGGTVNAPTGWQTVWRQGGGTLPSSLLPGQLFAADDGRVFIGDANKTPVLLGNQAEITQHISNTNNPHGVTRDQIGAAAASDLTSHLGNRSNPQGVTPTQIGAMPAGGGTFSGNVNGPRFTFQGEGRTSFIEQSSYNGIGVLDFRVNSSARFILGGSNSFCNVYGAAFLTSQSTEKVKENITPLADEQAKVILQLPVVEFDFKKDAMFYDGKRHVGVIAETVLELLGEDYIVRDQEGDIVGVHYEKLVLPLIATVQRQHKELQSLNERVNALEQKLMEDK